MKKLLLLLLLAFSLTSCLEFDDVRFNGIESVKAPKFENQEITLALSLKLDNPNNYKIKIKPSEVLVSIGGQSMGIARLDEKIVLKKKREGVYTTELKMKLNDGVMKSLLKLAMSKDLSIRFQGKIKGSVYGITKKVDIDETKSFDPALLKLLF